MRLVLIVAICIILAFFEKEVSCIDDSWEPRQLIKLNRSLPVVHILRVTSLLPNDFAIYAAADRFNNASGYMTAVNPRKQRFQIQLHREATNRVELTSVGHTLRLVMRALTDRTEPAYAGMIGPDFSAEAIPICQVTPFYNLVNVATNTYGGFSNIDNFPLYFRGTSTNLIYVKALLKLTKLLGIGHVSLAGTSESYSLDVRPMQRLSYQFLNTCTHTPTQRIGTFADLFKRQHVDVNDTTAVSHNSTTFGAIDQSVMIEQFSDIQFSMFRLLIDSSSGTPDYIVTTLAEIFPYVVCEAGRAIEASTNNSVLANMVAFLAMEHFEMRLDISQLSARSINCTQKELYRYANGSIIIQMNDIRTNPARYVKQKKFNSYETGIYYEALRMIEERSNIFYNGTLKPQIYVYNLWDLSWTLYTSLHHVDEMLEQKSNGTQRLFDFLQGTSNTSAAARNKRQVLAKLLCEEIMNSSFDGITGKFKLNAEHDRISNLDIWQFQGARKRFVGSYDGETDVLDLNETLLIFGTPSGEPPHVWRRKYLLQQQQQQQGQQQNNSTFALKIALPISVSFVITALLVASTLLRIRHLQHLRRGANSASNWIIPASLFTRQEPFSSSKAMTDSFTTAYATPGANSSHSSTQSGQRNQASRIFVGSVQVHVRNLSTTTMASGSAQLFIRLKQVSHDNVNRFLGVCFDYPTKEEEKSVVAVFEHQERGSIRRVLHNTEFGMDKDITVSFVGDCLRGLLALHERDVGHGLLHTGCVMLDAKLTCKLTDFSTLESRQGAVNVVELEQQEGDDMDSSKLKLIFRPPEQLRDGIDGNDVKQIDVFSVAVVMAEIINREEPTFTTVSKTKVAFSSNMEIVKQQLLVANGVIEPLLLHIAETEQAFPPAELRTLIVQRCANGEQPPRRPTVQEVYKRFQTLTAQYAAGGSVVERLGKRLEQYTNDLQRVVDERTRALLDETRRTEQLLMQLLPASVCAELKAGRRVEPETFGCVSIHYIDIVGFTALSARASPMQIVVLLNALYTTFDSVVDRHRTYKVETIGDAYIVVSGLPERTETHGIEICNFSLDIVATLQAFRIPYETAGDKSRLFMRIGVHCGPVAAGVVGIKMPRYCLFGNTVIEANRMESTGEPLRIHCSVEFYGLMWLTLQKKQHQFLTRRYEWEARTDQHGKVCSYWLRQHAA